MYRPAKKKKKLELLYGEKIILKEDAQITGVLGSRSDRRKRSWLDFWEQETGREALKCACFGCGDEPSRGAHVWVKYKRGEYCYIAAVCRDHYNALQEDKSGWFDVKNNTAVVRISATRDMYED